MLVRSTDLFAADHELVRVVGLLADVFEELRAGFPAQVEPALPRRRVGAGIVDVTSYLIVPRSVRVKRSSVCSCRCAAGRADRARSFR